jgi:subtilisin family serine protease
VISLFVLSYAVIPAFGIPDFSGKMRKEMCASGGEKAREALCENFMEGELLVKFKQGIGRKNKNNVHGKHFSKVKKKFSRLNIDHILLAPGLGVGEAMNRYNSEAAVEYAEPNYILHIDSTEPDDLFFGDLWNLLNLGQTGGTPGADIDATRAWDYTTGQEDIVVAVIDSGIDYTHEDLAPNMWVNSEEYYGVAGIDDDGNSYIDDIYGLDTYIHSTDNDPMDELGHGTHIAGTIGAVGNNGIGLVGVNWDIQIMACKFMSKWGIGTTDSAIECLDYVKAWKEKGLNIVATNNSWGGGSYSRALYDAINAQRDILFIASAGNKNQDNDIIPQYPAVFSLPNIISVASTDHNDEKASTSNYGRRSVHMGAPGVGIFSTLPEYTHWGDSFYGHLSGTSMASPHVAGIAALLKSKKPNRDWRSIKNLILSGGDSVESLEGVTITGKRANAYGALNCKDTPVFSVLNFPYEYVLHEPVLLASLSIDCDEPVGPVQVSTTRGETIKLHDNGRPPDMAANDGIFSAEWIPEKEFGTLFFTSHSGSETVSTEYPVIMSQDLPEATVRISYRKVISVEGVREPYTWDIVEGDLPAGLSLNSTNGELSGTPAVTGTFLFTVQVSDREGSMVTKQFSLTVNDIVNTISIRKTEYKKRLYELKVQASSNYGMYADLHVNGFGPMTWYENKSLWILTRTGLTIGEIPESITVTGPEGSASQTVRIK